MSMSFNILSINIISINYLIVSILLHQRCILLYLKLVSNINGVAN